MRQDNNSFLQEISKRYKDVFTYLITHCRHFTLFFQKSHQKYDIRLKGLLWFGTSALLSLQSFSNRNTFWVHCWLVWHQ